MATEDIKVTTIPEDLFLRVDPNNNYVLRFRIANEDGSQKSSWSPYTLVPAKTIYPSPLIPANAISISNTTNTISVSFVVDQNSYRPLYDIFWRWSVLEGDGESAIGEYFYYDTVSVPSITTEFPDPLVATIQYRIQVAGLTQEINENLLLGDNVHTVQVP